MATQTALPNHSFLKFVQFSKLEDSKDESDGMPTVWGIATWEQPDSDREICDYDTAKPVYQAWSAKALKRTSRAGQDPSLGNIRLQHGSEVGGKATKLEFDDPAKEVWLGSEPVNDDVRKALKGGYYTGYSQGGSYAWRACDVCETPMPLQQGYNFCPKCNKDVPVRYGLKRIAEVSYVDSPATGEGFEHVKANGSSEILKFHKKTEAAVAKTKRVAGEDLEASAFAYVGDPEKTDTWKLPIKFSTEAKTKRHIRNALARFEQTKGIPEGEKEKVKAKIEAAAKDHSIDGNKSVQVRELLKAEIDKAAEAKGFQKGLYAVGRFADLLESLACLYEQSVWEREIEGDESEVPDELRDQLDSLIETFIAMAEEEARELSAKKSTTGETTMTPEEIELQKAAKKSLASHFAKAASHHEKMADHHEALADEHEEKAAHHQKAMEGCEECMGKAKKEDVGSGAEDKPVHEMLSNQVEFHKAMVGTENSFAAKHDKIAKAHDKHAEHLHKMAESHDEETAKAVKAECAAADEADAKVEKDATAAPKAAPTMDDDVKKAAAAARNTQEYKDAVASIAKAQVDAEVAKLRESTLAPLGVTIDDKTGEAILKGARVVPRDSDEKFEFAKTPAAHSTAGL